MSFVSNLMDRTLQLMNQNMDGMTRLSNLLKNEQNLSNQQRQEANRLIHQLTPILCTLNTNFSQLAPLISNLQMGTQSGEARTMAVDTRPVLTNLQLHLHTNSNEIDRLNDQLNRVSEIMNQQFNQRPRIIRPGSTSGFGSITVVSEGTVPRGREERMNLGNILSGIMVCNQFISILIVVLECTTISTTISTINSTIISTTISTRRNTTFFRINISNNSRNYKRFRTTTHS